jgi:hypothetical protein
MKFNFNWHHTPGAQGGQRIENAGPAEQRHIRSREQRV